MLKDQYKQNTIVFPNIYQPPSPPLLVGYEVFKSCVYFFNLLGSGGIITGWYTWPSSLEIVGWYGPTFGPPDWRSDSGYHKFHDTYYTDGFKNTTLKSRY